MFTSRYPITHGVLRTGGRGLLGPAAFRQGKLVSATEYFAAAEMNTGAILGAFPLKTYGSGLQRGMCRLGGGVG